MSNLIKPLTNKKLEELAPTLFTDEPYYEVSEKYHFIPTIDVIEEIRFNNWYPVNVSEASVRNESKQGYQQHCVRFRHLEDLLNPKDNVVELLLFNSHDRSKCFSISAGIFRFVCSNGLVISDSIFESYKIKHLGDKENDVKTAILNITNIKDELLNKVRVFESITLSQSEKESFAKASIPLRFDNHLEVDYKDLLIPHRTEDTKDDLYTTFNVIQENLLKGNIEGVNKDTQRKFTSREITSISTDTSINKKLWDMVENIASIKNTQAHQSLIAA